MGTAIGIGILLLAIAGVEETVRRSVNANTYGSRQNTDYRTYVRKTLKDQGYADDTPLKDIVYEKYLQGEISVDQYKRAIEVCDKIDKHYGTDSISFGKLWDLFFTKESTYKEIDQLFKDIIADEPQNKIDLKKLSTLEGLESLNNISDIKDMPAPDYLDTTKTAELKNVDPIKWWSGQELADLHNLNFDPNYYYDLIKQGTEANEDLAHYTSNQLNNGSLTDDTAQITSYLDAIRNNRAEAIANGATAGAQAANELLSNLNAFNTYDTTQRDLFSNRFNTVNEQLLEDASAGVTAREYFDTLAKALADDSMGLYSNDAERYGADWAANAARYVADQNVLGARILANANMNAAYTAGQAYIDSARTKANTDKNEYLWLFKNNLIANSGIKNEYNNEDIIRARMDTNKQIAGANRNSSNKTDDFPTFVQKVEAK